MNLRSILSLWYILIIVLATVHRASAQVLMKKVINKKQTSATRQHLITATPAKIAASPHLDAGTGTAESANAGATFTVPNLGDGFQVVPAPSFNYTNVANAGDWGFTALVWGNTLGVDSNKQKAAANLLVPDISMLGLKMEGAYLFTSNSTNTLKFGVDIDLNLLAKKVSYFDIAARTSTNFNPFIFHPRVGLTSSLADIIFISVYGNMLSVLTHNDEFAKFFATKKSTFVFPEIDAAAIVNLDNTGKQQIKFEFDMLINNGDLQTLYNSSDKVIPYVKVGLVSSL